MTKNKAISSNMHGAEAQQLKNQSLKNNLINDFGVLME